jgi:hypothetical protein
VHGSALAVRHAVDAAEQLGEDALDGAAAEDGKGVAPVRGDDLVVGLDGVVHADRDGFLSDRQVAEAANEFLESWAKGQRISLRIGAIDGVQNGTDRLVELLEGEIGRSKAGQCVFEVERVRSSCRPAKRTWSAAISIRRILQATSRSASNHRERGEGGRRTGPSRGRCRRAAASGPRVRARAVRSGEP